MSSETETPDRARALLDRSEQEGRQQDILELISTIMVLYLKRVADCDGRGYQKPRRSLGRHTSLNG